MVLHRCMPPVHHSQRRRLVLKKRYGLYYLLSILYGARKQVFITFGPWVLIRIFERQAPTIALLWIIATTLTALVVPHVGRLVDRVGPRVVLSVDAVLLLAVCLTYGFARDVVPGRAAFIVVCGTYVLDLMLTPVQMARTVYLSRVAEHRRDVTGSLSMGVSIDHAVSIPIAMLGGRLWMAAGYRWVFAAAGAGGAGHAGGLPAHPRAGAAGFDCGRACRVEWTQEEDMDIAVETCQTADTPRVADLRRRVRAAMECPAPGVGLPRPHPGRVHGRAAARAQGAGRRAEALRHADRPLGRTALRRLDDARTPARARRVGLPRLRDRRRARRRRRARA